jgi:hypothetical protein
MRRIVIAVALLLAAAEAPAQERVTITGLTCEQVQALLKANGTAILRYRSAYNITLPLYDRYVSGQRNCPAGEVASRTGVPTTDRDYCPVYKCVQSDIFVAR